MPDEQQSLQSFIDKHGLTIWSEKAPDNPDMEGGEDMDHWLVRLFHTDKGNDWMQIHYSMGKGHEGKAPELPDVLDCLASDSSGYENARTVQEWLAEFGYGADSHRGFLTFRSVEKQAVRLQEWLGHDLYEELLWHTERE